MTDRDPPGSTANQPYRTPGGCLSPGPRSPERERTFGSPLLFDLTTLQAEQKESPVAPTVYYLAAMLPPPRAASPWRTVVGFGGVILAGLGLGLLLAALLL